MSDREALAFREKKSVKQMETGDGIGFMRRAPRLLE